MASHRGSMSHIVTTLLYCILLTPVVSQYNQFTTSVAPGTTLWYPDGNGNGNSYTVRSDPPSGTVTVTTSGTATTTTVINGRSIPTLVYNCEFMPFICRNIANHIQNQGDWKFDSNGLMKLHVDVTGQGNNEDRRDGTCENKSRRNPSLYHQKGYPNNCKNIGSTTGISTLYSKYFNLPVSSVDKQPQIILGPPDPTDPTKNLFSGLVYTCDEFPSASWIEGGRGVSNGGVGAEVICTPQSASCGAGAAAIQAAFGQNVNLGKNPSEQDWQARALSSLRAAVIRAHKIRAAPAGSNQDSKDPFVGVFFLSTTRQAAPAASRAWVIDEAKKTRVFQRTVPTQVSQKRDLIPRRPKAPAWGIIEEIVGNASEPILDYAPQPAVTPSRPTLRRSAFGLPTATATPTPEPLWTYNPVSQREGGTRRLIPRGVYQLRGRQVPAAEIDEARTLIEKVSPEIMESNSRKLAHPRTNHKEGSSAARVVSLNDTVPKPTSEDYNPISDEVKEAAALLAEFDARNGNLEYTWPLPKSNVTGGNSKRAATSYWYAAISPKGRSPFNPAGLSYQVYKHAIDDCHAKGDGLTDDTKAIQDCIADQDRCGGDDLKCASTSVMPLVIYFPPGNYLVSSNIEMYFQTLLVGDPIERPVIIAAPSFQGLGVLSSDYYIPGASGASWYVNQNNFMRQVRNFIIDIRNTPDNPIGVPAPGPACLHWQVAQATSLQNIDLYMKPSSRGHVGIFMENGSGGLITGLNFHGGYVGLRAGNQQFTIKDLTFENSRTAIQAIWDWTFLWQNIRITGATTGIDLINQDLKNSGTAQQTFAYLLLDSAISATTGIRTNPFLASDGYAQITLDNVDFSGSAAAVKQTTGETILAGGTKVDSWIWGVVATKDSPTGRQVRGEAAKPVRSKPPGLLGADGKYFSKQKPQYEDVPAGSFKNALSSGCKGDGVSDDTKCLQDLFGSPGYVFVPAGVYRVTDTIKVVSGIKIVGEAWSAITAAGDKFSDMTKPRVLVQVGEKGQSGNVEISDILFQVEGPMAGAVLVEWNIRADAAGSAGMWDTHFRVGGNLGSNLISEDCPRLSGTVNDDCIASSMLLHITPFASGYFENIWAWVADHDLETNSGVQIDIYSARGILIESTHPTWLYASASEHNVMYQYKIRGANNLFLGMIQTESPYYQSTPPAPKPFDKSVGLFTGDPRFSDCRSGTPGSCMAWGVMIEQSSNVLIYGAGLYSWFQKYGQHCLSQIDCQEKILYLSGDRNIYIYNLATVGTEDMVTSPGARVDGLVHNSPRSNVSSINGWLGDADGSLDEGNEPGATVTLSKTIWLWPEAQPDGKGPMTVACTPPCVFDFPDLTFPPLQPPPRVTDVPGIGVVTVTPPVVTNATYTWDPYTYDPDDEAITTITPSSNQTVIPVPPWSCGDACGGQVITFPPIPLPVPRPTDAPCWVFCDGIDPTHPPVVIGPGPVPGPPPPRQDDDDESSDDGSDDDDDPDCTPETCPDTCSGSDCTQGEDCEDDDCVKGGDCVGPNCTGGGSCKGSRCKEGGGCRGDKCDHGGDCSGDNCDHGGDCIGLFCKHGGGCFGLFCHRPGGCEGPLCGSGECVGPACGTEPCTGTGCDMGGCTGPNCDTGGCEGEDCDPGEDDDDDDDDDDEEEDEEPEFCTLNEDLIPNVDTADEDGMGVSGYTGADSNSGGNVGQGGIDGSGTGCIDDDGSIYPCQGSDNGSTTTTPRTTTTTTSSTTRSPTTTPPTTTTTVSRPTDTDPPPLPTGPLDPDHPPYCFRDHNDSGRWEEFTSDDAEEVADTMCYSKDELTPDDFRGLVFRGPGYMIQSVTWAQDQGGCSPKDDVPLGDWCYGTIEAILITCDFEVGEGVFGGGVVEDSEDYGCVTWYVGADSSRGPGARIAGDVNDQAVADEVAKMEASFPRIKTQKGQSIRDLLVGLSQG